MLDDPLLSRAAHSAIENDDNDIFVSPVAAYEMTFKHGLGKWANVTSLVADLPFAIEQENFNELPISMIHAFRAGTLADTHRDPFDRLLIAQALEENMTIVSNERIFDAYGVSRLW